MGEVRVEIAIVNPRTAARSEEIVALADTAATLTVVPGQLLGRLGIEKIRTVSVRLADGRRTIRDVGDAMVAVDGDSTPCRVVFGQPDDATLLGLTVLEQLGLAVDPVQRRLVSTEFLLF
jgi:predicted aspartyl protease